MVSDANLVAGVQPQRQPILVHNAAILFGFSPEFRSYATPVRYGMSDVRDFGSRHGTPSLAAAPALHHLGEIAMSPRPAPRLCHHRLSPVRRMKPNMEELELRALLSRTLIGQPTFVIGPLAGDGPGGGFTPAQIETGYGYSSISFNGTAGTGQGETIAIVDAYNDPNIQSDLNTFDSEFSLAALTVKVVNESGGSKLPGADPTGGWELEESLDVEWAHAMAPSASITLVEASSDSLSDLLTAVGYAAGHANVVSMSWGGSEFSGETSYDSDFDQAGVAFVASSGDEGAPALWPAASPNVLGVGGTALTLTSNNAWSSETGWSGSGGGPSAYESQPSYQTGVVTQTIDGASRPGRRL